MKNITASEVLYMTGLYIDGNDPAQWVHFVFVFFSRKPPYYAKFNFMKVMQHNLH